jgi:hypothetical protein
MESATTQSEPNKTLWQDFIACKKQEIGKSKVVSVYAMKAYMGSRSIGHIALLTATLGGD